MLGGWLLGGLIGSSAFNLGIFSLAGLLVSLLGASVLLAAVQLAGRRHADAGYRLAPAPVIGRTGTFMVVAERFAQESQVQAEPSLARSAATEHQSIADNESEGGRQPNRRAEVITMNPASVVAST